MPSQVGKFLPLVGSSVVGAVAGVTVSPMVYPAIQTVIPHATGSSPSESSAEAKTTVAIKVDQIFATAENLANQPRPQFRAAIDWLKKIPADHPQFSRAQQQTEKYAAAILNAAENKHRQGDINTAVRYLRAIPPETLAAQIATTKQPTWQRQAQILADADADLKQGKWRDAVQTLRQFKNTDLFTSNGVQQRLQQAQTKLAYAYRGDRG